MNVLNAQFARRTRLIAGMLLSTALAVTTFGESRAGMLTASRTAKANVVASHAIAAKNAIAIKDFAFQPATLTVVAGSKVVWTNRDEEPHLVVSAGGQFPASPALDTDDSYAAVLTKPGIYTYFCSIHPHMVGKIVVK
jgi:plastocyanin